MEFTHTDFLLADLVGREIAHVMSWRNHLRTRAGFAVLFTDGGECNFLLQGKEPFTHPIMLPGKDGGYRWGVVRKVDMVYDGVLVRFRIHTGGLEKPLVLPVAFDPATLPVIYVLRD